MHTNNEKLVQFIGNKNFFETRIKLALSISDIFTFNEEPCWLWDDCQNEYGYGVFYHKMKPLLLHRLVYTIFKGAIPDGLVVDHLCRTRNCCNFSHLEAVTHLENVRRGKSMRGPDIRFCKVGHPILGDNIHIRTCMNKGKELIKRSCLICHNASLTGPKQFCINGHEFTKDNTSIFTSKDGSSKRVCKECAKNRNKAYYENKPKVESTPIEFCANGHEFTEENTNIIYKNGVFQRRVCRQCDRDRGQAYRDRKKLAKA